MRPLTVQIAELVIMNYFHSKDNMGANHEVNSLTIFLDGDGAGKTKPKQAFRLTQTLSKSCYEI